MTFDVFTFIYNLIAGPLLGAVDGLIATLAGLVAPVLRWALIAFCAGWLLSKALKPGGAEPLPETVGLLVKGTVAIYVMASAAGYGSWARDVLLTGLPQEIGQALAGGLGGRPLNAAAFWEVWLKAWGAGLAVWRNIPPGVASLPLYAVVVLFWAVSFVAVFLAFAIWLKAFVALALLVGLGVLFAGLWLFPWTRGWFFGWLNTAMSFVVLQVLSVGLIALLVTATSDMLAQIIAAAPAPAATSTPGSILRQYRPGSAPVINAQNEVLQIASLFGAAALYGMAGWLAYQLPGLAGSIAHGFAGHAASAGRLVMGAFGPVAGFGASGAAAVASSAARQAAPAAAAPVARVRAAPGPSLSNP